MRVATFNIRNSRALDLKSLWWFRRAKLVMAMRHIDADIWGLQEAYPSQLRHLQRSGFGDPEWQSAGRGRNANGGGEAVPILVRSSLAAMGEHKTRWFGDQPDTPGSRLNGASHPRIATIARYECGGAPLVVVNLHLDSDSVERRHTSLVQLAAWLGADAADTATIVLGDFNGPLDEPGFGALRSLGLRSVLGDDAGPTSNGFGRGLAEQHQIDHIFVSDHFTVTNASIDRSTGYASDHYPVVAELESSSRTSSPSAR